MLDFFFFFPSFSLSFSSSSLLVGKTNVGLAGIFDPPLWEAGTGPLAFLSEALPARDALIVA